MGRAGNIGLRPFLPADLSVCIAIFQDAVMELAEEDYSHRQRELWAARADEADFATRLAAQLTLIATQGGAPVGFASLADNRIVDLLYVHPHAARQGVATSLLDALEKLGTARGATTLSADVSDTARPLFDKRGWAPERRNTVALEDEYLGNTTMTKSLAGKSAGVQDKAS